MGELPVTRVLEALGEARVIGRPPASVSAVTADSRKVVAGGCFVAVPGFRQDARRFVPEAVLRGASMIVTEGDAAGTDVCQVLVPSARVALARLADLAYGHPSAGLTVVGITGTNGKTTTSYLAESLLREAGPTGVIGTIQYVVRGEARDAGQTTPEALELQALLAEMRDGGVRGVAMEVSSHALALSRVDGIDFDVAVFTNLTQDHLDFHGTLEEYRRAKRRLFELLGRSPKPRRAAVINGDDPAGESMVAGLDVPVLRIGLSAAASVRAVEYQSALDGIRMDVTTPHGPLRLTSPLIGQHNVMNLLAAIGIGLALGMRPDVISAALARVGTVPGRFEQVRAGQPFLVVVDYAHTPDALERVLETARKLTARRLAVVFGCGGDRDRTKRPIMGEIAGRAADQVWVTSDNPRSEPPSSIIDEILAGVRRAGMAASAYVAQADREAAIRDAIEWARAGDTVVIAGKGHETYQIVAGEVRPFDDRAMARRVLMERAP